MNPIKLGWMAAVLIAVSSANAQTSQTSTDVGNEKYFGKEITVDAFGAYNKSFNHVEDIFDHSWRHGDFGGGVGLNYFVNRYVGVGADTFFQEKGEFFSNVSGNLFLRLPLGHSGLAPYLFGGGGRRFDPTAEWTFHGGVGLEFRFNRHTGIFADGRYIVADKTTDAALVRAGLRLAF